MFESYTLFGVDGSYSARQIKQKQISDTHIEFDRLIPLYLRPTLFHKAVGKKKFHRSFGLLLNTL